MRNEQIKKELTDHIIPFWSALKDEENGGFYGFMSNSLVLDKKADKGVILHARILWFFSHAFEVLKDESLRPLAFHAFEFIKNHCIDYDNGGVYWMCDYKGNPTDTMKHTYNIAFCIYALSAYYNAFGDSFALDLATKLFSDIEENTLDDYGYGEAFSRDWQPIDNEALSENGLKADKTMNTVLHLIEGYTELLRARHIKPVEDRLRFLLSQMSDIIYDPETNALKVFFDEKFSLVGDVHSYGHDIEATWLVDRACRELDDKELCEKFRQINIKIAKNIQSIAVDKNGAMNNERDKTEINRTRVWWVQAEAVVGFINAYQNSGDKSFLDTAAGVWDYIADKVIDKREGGEWFSELEPDDTPHEYKEQVGPWKCPYHNGRMCLEVITRGVEI